MNPRGFDFPLAPNGWIQVGWSDDLAKGERLTLRAFGRELVLFRAQSGALGLVDAYCPHLGAHLGVSGCVKGERLRCDFHGWEFATGGRCEHIPGATRIPERAVATTYPVHEANGLILAWHDAARRAPWFEAPAPPELTTGAWAIVGRRTFSIGTGWRELAENAVDRAHFHVLHAYPTLPTLELRTEGHRFFMTSAVPWRRLGRTFTVRLDIESSGPGVTITRGEAGVRFVAIGCSMPVEHDRIVHRVTFLLPKAVPAPPRWLLARIMMRATMGELVKDVPIWESKVCLPRPVLSDADGPIVRFRTWTKQFTEA
jgi:phenylpropionate dioxygenase-like ring-hydroxylating dioxygenase large terminal subunit